MIIFLKNVLRDYFVTRAKRSADEAAFCFMYYQVGSFGFALGDLHLAFARLYRDIAEAI